MRKQNKKFLLIVCGSTALVLIAAVIIISSIDINSYKTKIETAASDATGLQVRIGGKLGLAIFPFGISAGDINIGSKSGEIASVEKLKVGLELLHLLKKQIKVTRCDLYNPSIIVVKNENGKYNFEGEKKASSAGPGQSFSINLFKLAHGRLAYIDRKTGEKTELTDFNLSISDLTINDISGDIINGATFRGRLDLAEALQKDLRIENLKAEVKADKGVYKFAPLTIGSIILSDSKTGEKTELKDLNLKTEDLSLDTSGDIIKSISFTGEIECKEVRKKELKADNIKASVKGVKGVYHLVPLTLDIFGGKGKGDVSADLAGGLGVYKVNLKVTGLDFERLLDAFGKKKVIGGKGEMVASVTMKREARRTVIQSVNGDFSMRGDNLVLYNMDLDKVLARFEETQNFNLIDLGAFFIAGPLGTAATKGYSYGSVYRSVHGGQTSVRKFVSDWKINKGIADSIDCALATSRNRVALKGKLDLVRERYDNVIVAILNERNCAKFSQKINGPFSNPQIGAVSTLQSIAGPLLNIFSKAKSVIQGGRCEVFYNGSVPPPR